MNPSRGIANSNSKFKTIFFFQFNHFNYWCIVIFYKGIIKYECKNIFGLVSCQQMSICIFKWENFLRTAFFQNKKNHSIFPKNETVYIHPNHLLISITDLFNGRKIKSKCSHQSEEFKKIWMLYYSNIEMITTTTHNIIFFFIQTPTKIFVKKLTAFLEKEKKFLFTADHVINGKTKNPPIQMHFPWPMHWHWKLYQTAAAVVVHQTHNRLHF